ncbi:MAG: reverse transcriptase N-terminal domain-containing protein, partial [Candidatus Methanomethylophilaceae archaeon]|nr:reverse transcriptase N-terminal domain-containing protein [Candidatus Methanomethylophilaceae archaeon]
EVRGIPHDHILPYDHTEVMNGHGVLERVAAMQVGISRASMVGDQEGVRYLSERFLSSPDARMLAVRNVTSSLSTKNLGVHEA